MPNPHLAGPEPRILSPMIDDPFVGLAEAYAVGVPAEPPPDELRAQVLDLAEAPAMPHRPRGLPQLLQEAASELIAERLKP